MILEQFKEKYVGKAVHCDTEEQANELLKLAHNSGWRWGSGKKLIKNTYWLERQENTCYVFYSDKTTILVSYEFYKPTGKEIVKFESEEKKVKNTKKVFDLGLFLDYMGNQKRSNEDIKKAVRDWALDCHGLTEKEMSKINKATVDSWMKEVEVKVELTAQEIEILKALKVLGFNWIARDKNNELCAYNLKPTKNSFEYDTFDHLYYLKKYLFTFITWQDEEATEIEELLCGLQ